MVWFLSLNFLINLHFNWDISTNKLVIVLVIFRIVTSVCSLSKKRLWFVLFCLTLISSCCDHWINIVFVSIKNHEFWTWSSSLINVLVRVSLSSAKERLVIWLLRSFFIWMLEHVRAIWTFISALYILYDFVILLLSCLKIKYFRLCVPFWGRRDNFLVSISYNLAISKSPSSWRTSWAWPMGCFGVFHFW